MRPIAITVARMLEQGHYLQPLPLSAKELPPLKNEPEESMAHRVLKNYFQILDYNHLYFLQSDIDEFYKKYTDVLANSILSGDLRIPENIFNRFKERVTDRIEKNKILAAQSYTFSVNKTVQIDRKKATWPTSLEEADKLWKDRIEAEILQERLNKHPLNTPTAIVIKRYNQFLRNLQEQNNEDVIKSFLVALSESYDPHSEYMSPSDMDNFNIQMKLSLVGIGAILHSEDGYTKIVEVVPGGPADKEGHLCANDRIVAIANENQPFEDVVDMKLNKVVEKIRGTKGTKVRLEVIPAGATDPSKRQIIEVVRDTVKLKDAETKGEIIEWKEKTNQLAKFGWITMPSFYLNIDKKSTEEQKSTSEDLRRIIQRMKQENIQGLVIDLRRNGGGSLEEAIRCSGLFIGSGPVVQSKDTTGRISVAGDTISEPLYKGPLVVLINRLSASASEIFAAALQDYHRAIIVGDERSFGKGTVQMLIDVNRCMPFFYQHGTNSGSLKLTIQKFYRVSGGSTQHKGIMSDVVIPSLTDTLDIGESYLPNPLPYDEVTPQIIHPFPFNPTIIQELQKRSRDRINHDPEFQTLEKEILFIHHKLESNQLSLNEKIRRNEIAEEKELNDQLKKEKAEKQHHEPNKIALDVSLDSVNLPTLHKVKDLSLKKMDHSEEEDYQEFSNAPGLPDLVGMEALNILQDLVNLESPKNICSVTHAVGKTYNSTNK